MKKLFIPLLCLLIALSTGCQSSTSETQTSNIEFEDFFEKNTDKISFHAKVIIPDTTDIHDIHRLRVKRATYDKDTALNQLFADCEIEISHEDTCIGDSGDTIPYIDYESVDGKSLYMTGENLGYYLSFSSYINRCFYTQFGDPRNNVEKYRLEGEHDFIEKDVAIQEIENIVNKLGFNQHFEFLPTTYALDYDILDQEEYAMDMTGNEDTSKYKPEWTQEDNCYYIFFRQKINGLPVYYVYGDVFTEYSLENCPLIVLYSKDGIQKLSIDKLFEIEEEGRQVSLLTLDDISEKIKWHYDLLLSNSKFEVTSLELTMMAEKKPFKKTYEMFPVWIAFADEIKNKDGEETRTQIQMVIDAETGEIIS